MERALSSTTSMDRQDRRSGEVGDASVSPSGHALRDIPEISPMKEFGARGDTLPRGSSGRQLLSVSLKANAAGVGLGGIA